MLCQGCIKGKLYKLQDKITKQTNKETNKQTTTTRQKMICLLNTTRVEGRYVCGIRLSILIIGLSIRRHEKKSEI